MGLTLGSGLCYSKILKEGRMKHKRHLTALVLTAVLPALVWAQSRDKDLNGALGGCLPV